MNMWGILLYLKYVHIFLSSDDQKGLQKTKLASTEHSLETRAS